MQNFCKDVNVFQGTGEINLPVPQGIAATWFFIKAGCGNTSPAASLPFSKISVSPFSGGYPSGYGDNCPNSHSRPPHFEKGNGLLGFAHLQHSGTGAIGYYYNYAVVTPWYADTPERVVPSAEYAEPGYYSATLGDINCELTVMPCLALHRYTFGSDEGQVKVDFSNNGLLIPGQKRDEVTELKVQIKNPSTVIAEAVIEGVRLYFAVRANGTLSLDKNNIAVFSLSDGERMVNLCTAISARSMQKALDDLDGSVDFDTAKNNAHNTWNNLLSSIEIKTDDTRLREIFYSNLYHSLVKPSDWSGESFIYGGDGAFLLDFSTLWDMYKTSLPLIFILCKETGEDIAETLLKVGETLGYIPNSFGLTNNFAHETGQARMLGVYALLSAYYYGVKLDVKRMLSVIKSDVFADFNKDFIVDGKCASNTWMLDMADGCANAAAVARENGDTELSDLLEPLSKQWKSVYSRKTGLLKKNSKYYEGTHYNYSFRPMVHMDERIKLAGGNERFVALLDRFFGYGAEPVTLPTNPHDPKPVKEGMKLGRFEGFNNESDTETPFSYIFADRHDRTCEVIRAGLKYMFTTGKGGIPGNNDTGALSSLYVLCSLGLFPVSGQDLMLIASPTVDGATVRLSSGKQLEIIVNDNSDKNIYVKRVIFNDKEIKNYRMSIREFMDGGKLEFFMSDTAK